MGVAERYEASKAQFEDQIAYRMKNWNLIKDRLESDKNLQTWTPILEQSPVLLIIPGPQVAKEDALHRVLGLQFYDVGVDANGRPDPLLSFLHSMLS